VFSLLNRLQRTAGYQSEVQEVLALGMTCMETVERIFLQAGNDPLGAGFPALVIAGPAEVRVRADLTGSAHGDPDRGDPDGDTEDSGEDVTIRYKENTRSLEIIPQGGVPQPVATGLSAFAMQYLDAGGAETAAGNDVRGVRVTLTGASLHADPQTGRPFSVQLSSYISLAAKK